MDSDAKVWMAFFVTVVLVIGIVCGSLVYYNAHELDVNAQLGRCWDDRARLYVACK